MSGRPWMPLYVNDFRLDTLDLDAAQAGVYLILLMIAWRREDAAIPDDMAWLKKTLKSCISHFHGHEFNRIVPGILDRYFVCGEDKKWRNKRLTNERQKADKLSAKQKQNADKRWSAPKENNALADASAMPSQSQSQSQRKEDTANAVPSSGGPYAFESGVIRLKQRDFDQWKQAFSHLDVPAELIAMTDWAGQQAKWYIAVSNALNKKNGAMKVKIEQQKSAPAYRWNGMEGVT